MLVTHFASCTLKIWWYVYMCKYVWVCKTAPKLLHILVRLPNKLVEMRHHHPKLLQAWVEMGLNTYDEIYTCNFYHVVILQIHSLLTIPWLLINWERKESRDWFSIYLYIYMYMLSYQYMNSHCGDILYPHYVFLYKCSISQEICTRFLLCCALLWTYIDWFSHIHQAYFTGTVAI